MNDMLYDYSPVKKQCQPVCRAIQEQISSGNCRLVDLLDSREGGSRRFPEIFQERGGTLWTRQYAGLFEYREKNGGENAAAQIVIGSRFDSRGKPFFLCRLMESYLGESLLALDSTGDGAQADFFDQLLIASLAVRIQRAWSRGGLRAYRGFPRNDSHVRGRPDIPRHIRENLDLNNGRMAYQVRSYTLNTPENVLFLQACAAALKRRPNLLRRLERRLPEFRTALKVLEQAAPDWAGEPRKWVLEQTARRISNPIYREWEPVRRIARAVLSRMGTNPLGAEESLPAVTGVFLDIDTLWERLLEECLFRGAADRAFVQQSSRLLGGQMDMGIRPDFFFPSKKTVLDAKNRPDWACTLTLTKQPPEEERQDPRERKRQKAIRSAVRENIHQVLAYMLLLHCRDGGVVFPVPAECREPLTRRCAPPSGETCPRLSPQRPVGPYWSAVGRDGELRFWRIAVRIPDAEDYPGFRSKLDEEFSRLRSCAPVRELL